MIHSLIEGLEEEFAAAETDDKKEELANISIFILVSFSVALSGEKTLKVNLGEYVIISRERRKIRSTDMLLFRCDVDLKDNLARTIILLLFLI